MSATALLGLAVTLAAPDPKAGPLVGEWVAEAAVSGGEAGPAPKGVTYTFAADGTLTITGGRGKPGALAYKADPAKDPVHIDLLPPGGAGGPAGVGIYKVDGDTLTLCVASGKGAERPARFESPKGSRVMLMTLRRARKD